MLISFPNISEGGFVDGDVVTQAFAHFFGAIQAFENREQKNDLLRHAFFSLKIAPDENVEELVRPSEFHVGFHHHRIPSLHDWILNFMGADRVLCFDPRFEIFPLQHLLQRHAAIQANHVFERHGAKPVTVAHCLRALGIKNLKRLLAISRRVCDHFLMRQVRPRNGPTARVANHSGKIADDENRLVPEVLKLSQFSQNNRVPKVNIRCGRVHPKLDPQRPAQRKLLAQFAFIDDLRRALF